MHHFDAFVLQPIGGIKMKISRKIIPLLLVVCIAFATTGVVFADTISDVVNAVVNRVSLLLNTTGNSNAIEAEQAMSNSASDTKQKVDTIINSANTDIEKQLEDYKNAQLAKKNQEINSNIVELQKYVDQQKQEKLNEYKQKIDEKINSEYDKLIKELSK